jgi:hypothetical protein
MLPQLLRDERHDRMQQPQGDFQHMHEYGAGLF